MEIIRGVIVNADEYKTDEIISSNKIEAEWVAVNDLRLVIDAVTEDIPYLQNCRKLLLQELGLNTSSFDSKNKGRKKGDLEVQRLVDKITEYNTRDWSKATHGQREIWKSMIDSWIEQIDELEKDGEIFVNSQFQKKENEVSK